MAVAGTRESVAGQAAPCLAAGSPCLMPSFWSLRSGDRQQLVTDVSCQS